MKIDNDLLTQNNNTGCTVTTFLILRPTKLNHILCRGMGDIDLAKNSITVICQAGTLSVSVQRLKPSEHQYVQNAAHRIQDHLEHGFWT